jgi:hypothetical protein
MSQIIRVGSVLYGFCGGYFGRDSYSDKRVEAIGADWIVARDKRGEPVFAISDTGIDLMDELSEYLNPEEGRDV